MHLVIDILGAMSLSFIGTFVLLVAACRLTDVIQRFNHNRAVKRLIRQVLTDAEDADNGNNGDAHKRV